MANFTDDKIQAVWDKAKQLRVMIKTNGGKTHAMHG